MSRDRAAPVLLALACLVLAPPGLSAQDDKAGADPRPDTLAVDTLPAGAAPAALAAAAADTLSTRQRALLRLRGMRLDPVQGDSTAADSLATDSLVADSLAADTLPGDGAAIDTLTRGPLPIPADTARPVFGLPLPPGETPDTAPAGGRPPRALPPGVEPGDTLVLFERGDTVDEGVLVEDSIRALLRSLEGYVTTEYEGESAVFRAEGDQLELMGQSRVGQGVQSLATDSLLVYDGEAGIVCGYGTPVLSGEQDPIESDELCFNIRRNLGVAVGARTTFEQGATWYVRGARNRVYLLTGGESDALYGEHTEFTSCDLDHPHYVFKARSLKMVENDVMVARNITLEFDDVPVFWLPWMVQSMKRDRRSGLLMPEFGVNDIVRNSTGYNRSLSNLGFYWAINDYASAKSTFEWYSGNWTAVEGALTYRWLRQFLQGNVTAKNFWRQQEGSQGRREFTLNTSNSWRPDERTQLQLNANYATSTEFVRNNSFDPRELNRNITSSASVNRTFDWGSMTAGADRSEQLSTGQVDWKLPGVSLNLAPVTLLRLGDGLELTWDGSGDATRRTRFTPDTLGARDRETLDASYGHRVSFGKLGLNQRISWNDEVRRGPIPAAPLPFDVGIDHDGIERTLDNAGGLALAIGEDAEERLQWSTSLSYQQQLWPGTVVSPNLSINGNRIRDERTEGEFLSEPNRISTGATLNTSVYGFWPGFGDFSRIRHKIAPTLQWSYSPAPEISPLQEEVFGIRNLREQNRISLSFNQTFEAKVRDAEPADTAADANGEAGVGGAAPAVGAAGAIGAGGADDTAAGRAEGEPARLPQPEKVMLLALDTRTSFVYDFVAAEEEGRGFLTDQISNSIRSDLLQGLQISATHSLFDTTGATVGGLAPRRFDPFLTNLTASFSIDDRFWLFDLLGLSATSDPPAGPGRDAEGPPPADVEGVANSADAAVGAEADPDRSPGRGSIIPDRGPREGGVRQGVGGWRASLNYSLSRRRPGQAVGAGDSQLLSANISFQPTGLWSLRWSTAYSFTDGEFANHVLTLTRDLHRWQANFDFVKAQNGNFAMRFRVQLRDNPDLKLDYDQRTDPSDRGPGRVP